MEYVVHHAARVADLEAARLDAADRGRTDDVHLLLLGDVDELPRHVLRDPLGDDGDRPGWRFNNKIELSFSTKCGLNCDGLTFPTPFMDENLNMKQNKTGISSQDS